MIQKKIGGKFKFDWIIALKKCVTVKYKKVCLLDPFIKYCWLNSVELLNYFTFNFPIVQLHNVKPIFWSICFSRSSWSSTAEEYTHSMQTQYHSGYEEIGREDTVTCRSRCCNAFKKIGFIAFGLSVAPPGRHRRIKKQRRYERLAATSQLSLW